MNNKYLQISGGCVDMFGYEFFFFGGSEISTSVSNRPWSVDALSMEPFVRFGG